MRAFYLIAFLGAFDFMRAMYRIVTSEIDPEFLWPAFWANWVGLEIAGRAVILALPLSCVAALLKPGSAWPRVLVFISFLQYSAIENSFGSINHHGHYFIWISCLMIFMPRGKAPCAKSSTSRHFAFIFGIFASQSFIALLYSLSGFNKILGGFPSHPDQVSSFAADALPLLTMGRWDETGEMPFFGELLAAHPILFSPAHLSVIYFELVFLVAVFRPQLHRLFGFVFAAFHLGVWFTMGITFPYQPVLIALLFIWSPAAQFDRATWRQQIAQLPIIDLACWLVSLPRRKPALT